MSKLKLAIIGRDVSNSMSPVIHTFLAGLTHTELSYAKISVPDDKFEDEIDGILKKYDGFNVTIPYKISIIPHLNGVAGDAAAFGAVNTITARDLIGYNTDGNGFSMMLENGGVQVGGKNVLVLGGGGAGRSVTKKLADSGANVSIYDHKWHTTLRISEEFRGVTPLERVTPQPYFMIVNATGVGMHKSLGLSPVDEDIIDNCEVAVDLIYAPSCSKFLELANSLGKKTLNGEGMLFYQAYFARCIFFGEQPDNADAQRLFSEYLKWRVS